MGAVLEALLGRILVAVLQTLGLVSTLNALLTRTAQEHVAYQIEATVVSTALNVANTTYGLAAIRTEMDAFRAETQSNAMAIITAIASLPQPGDPVVLPTDPPSGYGGMDASTIWSAVWNLGEMGGGQVAWPWIKAAGQHAMFKAGSANIEQVDDRFAYFFTGVDAYGTIASFYPVWDTSAILPEDSLLSYLTRVNPDASDVFYLSESGRVRVRGNTGDGFADFLSLDDEVSFAALKAWLFGSALAPGLPLWPGLANVILGAPTALAMGVTIAGPMDGVLIEITSAPLKQGYFTFDTLRSYRNVGALAFVTDDGEAEFPQTLGFVSAVYVPKAMLSAASVVVRCSEDVIGTCTPWVAL